MLEKKSKITYTQNPSTNLQKLKKISKTEYLDLKTGVVKKYSNSPTKSTKAIRRTLKDKLQPLLENNFDENSNAIMLTLTTQIQVSNFTELTHIFTNFWNRFTYKFKDLNLVCVYIKELQDDRNCWHFHVLVKDINHRYISLKYHQLRKIWKHGIVWITRINPYARYINKTFYLSIPELVTTATSQEYITKPQTTGIQNLINYMCKLESKDGYIPTRGKIYGSKGKLKQPTTLTMRYDELKDTLLQNKRVVEAYSTDLIDNKTNAIVNTIEYEIWK